MGISPAPPWATILFALHERTIIPQQGSKVLYYHQFIDDIFGIWKIEDCPVQNKELWITANRKLL